MASKGLKKEIKRAKIELKDDPSIDSKTPSYPFDKTMIDNREPFISLDDFKRILTSNKSIGDAITSIFQVQLDFAHILSDVISDLGNSKKDEKDKSITATTEISSNFESVKFGKGYLSSYFKLERIERDIIGLLGLNRREKTNSNKSSFVKSSRTSPPLSARVWESKVKRSSVPQLLTDPKSRTLTEESTPKNILPLQGFNEKSPPTNPKANTSLHISLNKINKNSPKKSPNSSITENSKWLSSKLLSPQNPKVKASVSPQRRVENFSSNPSSHRDLRPDKTLFSEYLLPPKNVKSPAFSTMDNTKTSIGKTHHKTPSTQLRIPNANSRDRDSQFERKLSTKPIMGELEQKDLGEDSPHMEVTNDEKMMSRETTNLMNETDKTFRTTDMEDKSQKVNITDPNKQKTIIRDLFKEEIENYQGGFPKSSEGSVHQRKFLIDAKWLRSWRDYVNFDVNDDAKNMFDMKSYAKPSKIINKVLLKSDLILDLGNMSADLELKDNLLDHHDFEALPQKVFDQLARWYGCDFEISRFLRPDPFRNNKLFLDLYPNKPGKMKQYDSNKSSEKSQLSYANMNSDNKVIKEIISSNLVTNAFKKKK